MRRILPQAVVAVLGASLVAAPVAAQDDTLDRIDLPAGWQPEGVTSDGSTLFAGSLADGAILTADPVSGETAILVPGAEGKVSVGVDLDPYGRLWVAGGPTGEVRAYDAASGELLGTYAFEAGFLNDLAATGDGVYVTDSFMPQVLVVPLGDGGALPAPDGVAVVPIGGELEYVDGFNLNGIVATPAGLLAVHSSEGALYRIDPATGEASRVDIGGTELTNGDGLELDGGTLYVVRNQLGQIAVLELDEAATTATALGVIESDDFDVPTTVAVLGDDLWAVNARFGTTATPETEYWMTRVDGLDAAAGMTEDETASGEMGSPSPAADEY
jgi:hypothetical protein